MKKGTKVVSTLKHIVGNSNPIPEKPVLLINKITTEKTGYSVSHLLLCRCAECDRKDKNPSKASCVTLEFVDKSALEICRFNGKLCKEIRYLDKLHKPGNNRRKTILYIKELWYQIDLSIIIKIVNFIEFINCFHKFLNNTLRTEESALTLRSSNPTLERR